MEAGAAVNNIYALIMAGGAGTRFWPWSRAERPKQLLSIDAERALVRRTVARLLPIEAISQISVLTTTALVAATTDVLATPGADGVAEALQGGRVRVLDEPEARGTAACIGLGVLRAMRSGFDGDAVLLALPADHYVGDDVAFREDLRVAVGHAAQQSGVTTLGAPPTRPETGYGYLELESAVLAARSAKTSPQRVRRFVEKPSLERAEAWLAGGRHLWNTGIFAARLGVWREAFAAQLPELTQALEAFAETAGALHDGVYSPEARARYAALQNVSIDVGMMEKMEEVWTVPARFPWSDVGTWGSIDAALPLDGSGNAVRGDGYVLGGEGNVVIADGGRFVAAVGLRDTVIVDVGDAVLVLPKDRAQDVRALVAWLAANRPELL